MVPLHGSSHLVYGFLFTVKGTAAAQWIALAVHGQLVVGSNFESNQVHWWCQEGHSTTIAPVLQRQISFMTHTQKKTQFKVFHMVWRL